MTEGRDVWLHDLDVLDDPETRPPEPMDAEDLLFLMYTSGTTAKPKGIAHTTGGYLVGVASTHALIFDLKPEDDVVVRGRHRLDHRPQLHRSRAADERHPLVLYEGTPTSRTRTVAEIVERYGVTTLYTAPTAIRAHMKWGPSTRRSTTLTSLRLLGTVGEPINPEAWVWYREHIGGDRTPVVDTWWQTETGMVPITPPPGVTTLKPGSATKPFPGRRGGGVQRGAGEEVGLGGGGYLVLEGPGRP